MAKFRTAKQMDEVYQRLNRDKIEPPYIVEVRRGNQILKFMGMSHTTNPEEHQFKILKSQWKEFLANTRKATALVLIEGGNWPVGRSERDAIKRYQETGLMKYWAHKAGIKNVSPEPDRKKEMEYLAAKFSRDDVILYYFVRQVPQWQRLNPRPPFDEYMGRLLKGYQSVSGWKNFDFSVTHLRKVFKQKSGKTFHVNMKRALWPYYYPQYSKVSSVQYRDKYIFGQIKKYWDEGKSLFIVYGSGHAITLEPSLKELANA